MRAHLEIAAAGAAALVQHPLRSVVTIACLLAVLVPYLAAMGLSQGVRRDAERSVAAGADIYLSGRRLGRPAPAPLAWAQTAQEIDGVERVTGRIVGAVTIGRESLPAVLVGVSRSRVSGELECVEGRMYREGSLHEVVIGSELARRLRLAPGDRIPPFYRSSRGDRVSQVVGVFKSDVSLWEGRLIVTSLETAAFIFDSQELATDLLIDCRPGYEQAVAAKLARTLAKGGEGQPAPHLETRDQVSAQLHRRLLHREGIFNLHYLLAFSVAILAILVTSGMGLAERRREIGVLKATGWQTDEVLLRSFAESLLLCLAGVSLAILLAYAWLEGLNGAGVAGLFLAGVGPFPQFEVPFELTPLPALLSLLVSLAVVLSGTLISSWRAATAPPRIAMG